MRKIIVAMTVIGGLTFCGAMPAAAASIPAKLKSAKVQGDLVPAFACEPNDTTADCSGSIQVGTCSVSGAGCGLLDPCTDGGTCTGDNVTKSALNGRDCTFEKGTFKLQTGKDTAVQISGLKCVGSAPASLCGNLAGYSTIMSQNIGSKGEVTPITCPPLQGQDPAGSSNFAISQIGNITCTSKGVCKGVITNTVNPCPNADAVTQVISLSVFDGPASVTLSNINGSGVTLKGCCGVNQYLIPGLNVADQPDCQSAGPQDVLATIGNAIQIK